MKARTPLIPYSVDFDQELDVLVFFKEKHTQSDFDRITATVIQELINEPALRSRDIVLWRGAYANSLDEEMWVLGTPQYDEFVHNLIQRATMSRYDDWGTYHRVDTGCEPYVLISGGQLWLFDAMNPADNVGELILWQFRFPVRSLPCVHSKSKNADAGEDEEDGFSQELLSLLEKWKEKLADSATENWTTVLEDFPEFLYLNQGDVDFQKLLSICQDIIRLPVHQIPMRDYGRTVVRPVWEEQEEAFAVTDYSISIAINRDIPEKQKLLVLAHELAHYAYHYTYLTFFAVIWGLVQDSRELETNLAEVITREWQQHHVEVTEMRADIVTSYFAVPFIADKGADKLEEISYSSHRITGDAQRLHWIKTFFEDDGYRVAWGHVEQIARDAAEERAKTAGRSYDYRKGLYDRLVWCLFNRDNHLGYLNEAEGQMRADLEEAITIMNRENLHREKISPCVPATLIRRLELRGVIEELSTDMEFWDPVIIEPQSVACARGYIGLVPGAGVLRNSPTMYWARWEIPQKVPGYSLNRWIQFAGGKGKGLMLFPLSPLDIQLRQDTKEN